MKDWDFIVDGETVTTRMSSSLQVNDADGYLTCGLQGLASSAPSYVVRPYLGSGRLRESCRLQSRRTLSVVYATAVSVSGGARLCRVARADFTANPLLRRGSGVAVPRGIGDCVGDFNHDAL